MDKTYQDISYMDNDGNRAFVLRQVTIHKMIFNFSSIEIYYHRDENLCKIVCSKLQGYKIIID